MEDCESLRIAAVKNLSSLDPAAKTAALECLGGMVATEDSIPLIVPLLADSNLEVRCRAQWAVQEIGIRSALDCLAICGMLAHRESEPKLAALNCLEPKEPLLRHAIPRVFPLLDDTDTSVQVAAAKWLLWRREPGVIQRWFESSVGGLDHAQYLWLSQEERDRIIAMVVLAESGVLEPALLSQGLRTSSMALASVVACGRTNLSASESTRSILWKDSLVSTIASVILGENAFEDPGSRNSTSSPAVDYLAIDSLLASLVDSRAYIREAAACAIQRKRLGTEKVVKALKKALLDRDDAVRAQALRAMSAGERLDSSTISCMAAALTDPVSCVRHSASYSLRALGRAAQEVVDVVLAGLSDSDPVVRRNLIAVIANVQCPPILAIERFLEILDSTHDSYTLMHIKMAIITLLPMLLKNDARLQSLHNHLFSLPVDPQLLREFATSLLRIPSGN
jgi:HEAT repeat protein